MAKAEAKVEELVGMIERGELRLPEMQRRYVWKATRVRDLVDSLYRGYPSGAILVWETDEAVPLRDFAVGQQTNPYQSTKLLLDGQQRLTSLLAVLRGQPIQVRWRKKPIELLFNLEHPDDLAVVTEVDEVEDNDDDADTADADEDDVQSRLNQMTFVVYAKRLAMLPHWVLVSEVFKTESDKLFLKKAGILNFDDPRYEKYSQRLAKLRSIRNYVYRMDVLERTLSYNEVTEIFVRVNSLGAKLRGSDLAMAQITAKWRASLKEFEKFQKECADNGFDLDLGIHVKNLIAFTTGQSRFLTVGNLTLDKLQAGWMVAQEGFRFAINFLKANASIESPALLSSPFLLISLGYYGHQCGYTLNAQQAAELRYWLYVANAKGRYSRGSSETLLDQDLARIRDGKGVAGLIETLTQQFGRLDIQPADLEGRNARSAYFKTMFMAFRQDGAKDWTSNLAISLSHGGKQHRLVRNMTADGCALCVPGNHDMKLLRKLRGKNVQITHGLAETVAEIDALPEDTREPFTKETAEFVDGLISHYVLDDGKLVVAHAGMKEEMQGRGSGKVREFALYGETTGETDEFGLPVRCNWAAEYRGRATVVYGHTPVPEPDWLNRTTNIDTGCVFGGKLTALRWPEREFVSVPAARTYCEPVRPFLPEEPEASALTSQQIHDDLLDAEDVIGKRIITTRLRASVTIREENAVAALEIMSRFAANPKWLIYLPPTMSPCETSEQEGILEYPTEAFSYYRSHGVSRVVCQQKHMGSRSVIIVCQNKEAAQKRFGIVGPESGVVLSRTGRPFFSDTALEAAFLARIRVAMDAAGFWAQFNTDWACLDCELMPWSVKAQELLHSQYAAVGASGRASLPKAVAALRETAQRMAGQEQSSPVTGSSSYASDVEGLLHQYENRGEAIEQFVRAYREYCWSVASLDDLKLAPFHLMATEGKVHTDQDHVWHMETLAAICRHDPALMMTTPFKIVDLTDFENQQQGVDWWLDLTGRGGEGMVVKPYQFISTGSKGLVQPAVKCRGREYLRIIYGPEYTFPENLSRLRKRGLATKRSLALREFALGIEALERFVRQEPLRRVHECVFGVLALESEPVDPRL